MPALSRRNAAKLLSQVNGKQHARQEDHVDTLPTPPATNSTRSSASRTTLIETNEDINREPESSDDEQTAPVQKAGVPSFTTPRQVDGAEDELRKPPVFQQPSTASPRSAGSRLSNASETLSSDSDAAIFSSQNSPKRRKIAYGGNIHAQPRPRPKQQTYSKAVRQSSQKKDNRPGFQPPRKEKDEAEKVAPGPKFQAARGADIFEFTGTGAESNFQVPKRNENEAGYQSLSPSLSSLSSAPTSPGVEVVEHLNLPPPRPYVATTECAICGQDVDLFLKEEFENQHTQGKLMSYKWQQRFCRYHKRHEAQHVWQQRCYPNIDWKGLEKRMQRHHSHLKDIMAGAKSSQYRDELSERLKTRSKTAMQSLESDGAKQGGHVGYYGPRGEKLMTDHIIAHLSDSLREIATKDRLVAASGVSGGVSGFVQAVLVPELAEKLVQEDMKVSDDKAREILAESAELGDLLSPEVDESVEEVVSLDD